jgi:hypothetical protein
VDKLSSFPNILSVSQALVQQTTWKYANTPLALTQFYKHLMLVFDAVEVLNIIRRVLARQEVNWETVLSFAATFLVLFRDASDVYKGMLCTRTRGPRIVFLNSWYKL